MNSKRQRLPDLPHLLIEAVKNQRAVVFLGAGASKECKDSAGSTPPDGNQMRDILAKTFLGTENDPRDLMTVAEISGAAGAGEPAVFDAINNMLSGFSTSSAHEALAAFKWRGLATTNYDLFVEEAYAKADDRKQSCLAFVSDIEPYEDRLRREQSPLPYIKLHGCLNHRLDSKIPLVLSHEHYDRVSENRKQLLQRIQHWASESPVIFIGYTLSDPHIRSLIYQIERGNRPFWYIVTPSADEHDVRFWATKNVEIIKSTFGNFMDALDNAIPSLFRSLATVSVDSSAPYRQHFRTNEVESDFLREKLQNDLQYVHGGLAFTDISPPKFYSGHEQDWCGIIRKYDFKRRAGEDLLYKAILETEDGSEKRFFLLQGPAGAGKTIAMRRAAYDAAVSLDGFVFWLKTGASIDVQEIEELYNLTGKTAIVFVDSISQSSDDVLRVLSEAERKNIPIVFVGSEREADWSNYCAKLEDRYPPEIIKLKHLSEREVDDLLDLLERHSSLGLLADQSREDQKAAFMSRERSDRQLLVALHELTLGKPFEDIVFEEYSSITPSKARQMYLDIATMHQFGTDVRAGTISRISGIRFSDFEQDFFRPLADIVQTGHDFKTGDRTYMTRHSRVAEIVFGRVCETDEDKSLQLTRLMEGLDPGFSSDARVLNSLCKGRNLGQQFSNIENARAIFELAHRIAPQEAYLYQQDAILESSHRDGSLDRAEEFAEHAQELDGNNHIYVHTLAEIARKKASIAKTQVQRDHLRSRARNLLGEIRIKDSRKDVSYCKLLVDEVLELAGSIDDQTKDHEVVSFDDKLSETTSRLAKAQSDFPDEAEVAATEAFLWRELGNDDRARSALLKAIRAKPRTAGIYARLARMHREQGDLLSCIKILGDALAQFPDDKPTHLQLALAKIANGEQPGAEIESNLRSAFTIGDNNYDARYFLAEYLFWTGRTDDSQKLFDDLDRIAPATYRTRSPRTDDEITSRMNEFSGTVLNRKERFFFIKSGTFPKPAFAFFSALRNAEYEDIENGQKVSMKLRFNRQGPCATEVNLI